MKLPSRLLFVLPLVFVCAVASAKSPDVVERRKERLDREETRVEETRKVRLSVHNRVPVIEVVGYAGTNFQEDALLLQLTQKVRPIAERVRILSGNSQEPGSYRHETAAELDSLREELFRSFEEIYGVEARTRLEAFLASKYRS